MSYRNVRFNENSCFLVTGGAGFIGSNLCEVLLDMGYKVKCLDDLSNGFQSNVDLFIDHPNYEFVKGDIRDFDTCLEVTKGIDFVLHQAAWGGSVPRSIEMPLLYEEINIRGTLNMLEASLQNKVKKNLYMRQVHRCMVMNLICQRKKALRESLCHHMQSLRMCAKSTG